MRAVKKGGLYLIMKRFASLFFTNFWGVLNDNFLKTLACFVAVKWVDEAYQSLVISLAAGALVLPYILLSPLADRLTSIYDKKRVIRIAKWAELPIMALAILGFVLQNVWVVIAAIVVMGTQSCLYSPSKYGLIRDIGGRENVSTGMGGMEAVAFLGMLLGTVAASFLAEEPIEISYALLIGFASLGLIGSYIIKAHEEKENVKYSTGPVSFYREALKFCRSYKGLMPIIRTLSIFWWMAATIQIGMIIYGQRELGLNSFETGLILATAAVGITLGCVIAGYVDRKNTILHLVPVYGVLLAIMFTVLFAVPWKNVNPIWFTLFLFLTTIVTGFFKIPLDAEIQRTVKGASLNLVLAFFNQISFIYILIASATFALLTLLLPIRFMFLMIAVVMLIASIYIYFNNKEIVCHLFKNILSLRYDVRISGRELMYQEGVKLVLPSHRAVVDPFIVLSSFWNITLQPLVDEAYFANGVFRHILSLFDSIMVPDVRKNRAGISRAKMLNDVTVNALKGGQSIIFYPSGHITTDGRETLGGRNLAYSTSCELPDGITVLGMRIIGLWGSKTSRYGRRNTPPLLPTFLKNTYKFFGPKRVVKIEIEDITAQVKEWAQLGDKMAFNAKLEEFYNKPWAETGHEIGV